MYVSFKLGSVCNFCNSVNTSALNDWIAVVMNRKGCRKKQSWPDFRVFSKHMLGRAEENHKKFIWLVPQLRFELDMS
jgi:hypothetical protein